jgi:glutaredoxin
MLSGNKLGRIVVFGAEYCSFCLKAKTLLEKANTNFSYLDVEEESTMEQLKQYQRQYNYKTIPMIFVDSKFIGGYRELYQLVNSKQINLD